MQVLRNQEIEVSSFLIIKKYFSENYLKVVSRVVFFGGRIKVILDQRSDHRSTVVWAHGVRASPITSKMKSFFPL